MRLTLPTKRLASGLLGATILSPVLFFSYNVGLGMYYEYVLFPRQKAEEHYIAPTRWQDFAFLALFWTTAFVLSLASLYLIRFAIKQRSTG